MVQWALECGGLRYPRALNNCLPNTNKTKTKTNPNTSKRPIMRATDLGGMSVKHMEFCGTLDRGTTTIESHDPKTGVKSRGSGMILPLNAGDGITFPWLNGVATRFEKYKFVNLKFKFVPSVSTMYGGALAMCPIYDPADEPPHTRRALYNTEGAVHAPVHRGLTLTIPKGRLNRTYFVRSTHAELTDPNELRLSDIGYLTVSLFDLDDTVASSMQAASVAYGDVFVEYEVVLISPRASGTTPKHAHMRMRGDSTHIADGEIYHSLTGGVNSELHGRRGIRDPANISKLLGHSEGDTLALQYLGSYDEVYWKGGLGVQYDCIQFKEPFSGIMTLNTKSPRGDLKTEVAVNGVTRNGSEWTVAPGKELAHKQARVEHIDTMSVIDSHQIFKFIADAGETIALAYDGLQAAEKLIDNVTNLTWTEMGEAAIDLLIGLI